MDRVHTGHVDGDDRHLRFADRFQDVVVPRYSGEKSGANAYPTFAPFLEA
jgi:hypothetical protein